MSYELRTPLHGILGMTEALLESGLTRAQRLHAEAIRRNAERLLAAIDDVLDGRVPEARAGVVQFDLRELLRDVLARFACQSGPRDVAVTCMLDGRSPGSGR